MPGEAASRNRRTLLALGIFAAVLPLLLGAAALWLAWAPRVPKGAVPVRNSVPAALLVGFGLAALILGGALAAGLIRRWRSGPSVRWAVAALILVTLGLEMGAEALIDPVKRSDDLTRAIAANFPGREPVPAYLPPVVSNEAIFGIIGFKLGRLTHPLSTAEDVEAWLASHPGAPILVRMEQFWRLPPALQQRLRFVYDERGGKAAPFGIAVETSASDMQNHR
jgi:hypothetical protein